MERSEWLWILHSTHAPLFSDEQGANETLHFPHDSLLKQPILLERRNAFLEARCRRENFPTRDVDEEIAVLLPAIPPTFFRKLTGLKLGKASPTLSDEVRREYLEDGVNFLEDIKRCFPMPPEQSFDDRVVLARNDARKPPSLICRPSPLGRGVGSHPHTRCHRGFLPSFLSG